MRSFLVMGAGKGGLAALVVALGMSTAIAQTLTVTGITTTSETTLVEVPLVEVTGSTLTEADVRAIFSGDMALAVEKLSTLDAQSLRIPELSIKFQAKTETGAPIISETVYRDLLIENVVDGVAGSVSVGGADSTSKVVSGGMVDIDKLPEANVTFGRMTTGLFDIGGAFGFYGLGAKAGGTEMKPLYRDFAFDGFSFTSPEVSCKFGAARAAEFRARPLRMTFDELMKLSGELQMQADKKEPSPESLRGIVDFYIDIFTAFESSPTTFDGFECTGDDGKKALSFSSGPMTIDGFQPGLYPAVSLERFRFDVPNEGWAEFGNFTWKAMDLRGPIEILESAGVVSPAWFVENWRLLIPSIAGFSMADLSMDIPMEGRPGGRTAMTMDAFDLTLADYVNGIPSNISSSTSNLEVALPVSAETEVLRAAGIDKLNAGYDLDLHWNKADSTIVVDTARVDLDQLGTVTLSGVIGKATDELFSLDMRAMQAAAFGLTLKSVTIDLTDAGGLDLILARAAKEQGSDPAAFRIMAAGMAQAMPMAMLGASPDALAVGNAIRQFIEGTPGLKITLTAKNPDGLSLMELERYSRNPAGLSEVVTVTAVTSGVKAQPELGSQDSGGQVDPVTRPRQQEKLNDKAAAAGQ